MDLFDTHCHLTAPQLLPHADRIIANALQAGVGRMLTIACSADEVDAAIELRARHPGVVYIAAGIHPHQAARAVQADLDRLDELWGSRRQGVVAAGEIGLDYHYDFSPQDIQRDVFARQLRVAAAAALPVIIHCRKAQADSVRLLREHGFENCPVVFHCFSGTRAEAEELWSQGWWTSFTGMITFKNAAELQQTCAAVPSDQLMFETDAPYLSPEPVRRMHPNEPQNVLHTIRFAAALRGIDVDELGRQATANALRFFGIPNA